VFDLLVIDDFFDAATCQRIVAELRAANAEAATVYGTSAGGAVQPRVRSVRRVDVSPELHELVSRRFLERKPEIARHFAVNLDACEPPQFLRYEPGDFFVAHQDGNTPLVRDETRLRRVSIVVFLNAGYEGGVLTLHGSYPDYNVRHPIVANPGALVAFRSETTHEVTPVTEGERFTIVSWYRQHAA
jgi:predicted 2-oxoglutarate/Fe(II)-dependent dioxygenase YbiX